MKYFIFLFALLFRTSLSGNAQTATRIIYRGEPSAAVDDLKACLQGYSAGTVEIFKSELGSRTGQEFYIECKFGKTTLKYTNRNSLENAIYTFLDMLGFRWYGPSEHWFIKPNRIKKLEIDGIWKAPSFRNRSFFGTGGLNFGRKQPYDPENEYKEKWYVWKRRNRFNADFEAVGHSGRSFYLENKAILDKNPNWFLNEKGKVNGRIKIDQPDAVSIYKQWVRKRFEISKTPFVALGVDPEDGRGGTDDPLPKSMNGINNHADKWWWLANEVAKDYPINDPKVVITAYAYGNGKTNALVPSFELRKNVYPVIIPYAFQQAYTPTEMIQVWASKVKGAMGIYDYWNITQWSVGLPQFNIYSIPEKLKFWSSHKIDGVYLETTDAAGPMGHALWLTGQMEWDLNQDFKSLYHQYLRDCFGDAEPILRRMFDRWSYNYQAAGEVALSLKDLKEASKLIAKESNAWKRLADLKAYVHYMRLYYELDGTQQKKDALFNYMFRIHHLMLVQTAAFVGRNYIKPGNINPLGYNVKPITLPEIESQFQTDLSTNPVSYELSSFVFDFDKVDYLEPIDVRSWRFGSVRNNLYFKSPFTGSLKIDAGAISNTKFRISEGESSIVDEVVGKDDFDYTEDIDGRTWCLKRYELEVEEGKVYKISTNGGFGRLKFISKGIVVFKNPGTQDFDNFAYPKQYFYVPKNVEEIVFFDAHMEGLNGRGFLVQPDGTRIKRQPSGIKNIYKVTVNKEFRGRIWMADFGHPSWSLKNIPNIVSLQRFSYSED